ncbi:MAG: sigma-70 family RNA polymerase sigma factor [Thermomicrobiales bacterium]
MHATLTARRRRKAAPDTTDASVPLAALDDADLVRQPDRAAAFAILYERYAPRVIGYYRSRIRSDTDAEEIAAQTLAKAWAGFPPDHRGTFRCWLFTIAHHTIVDYYRQSSRAPAFVSDAQWHAVESSTPHPEETSIAAETRAELIAAILALPPDQQHAIALRIAGMKGREVADVMGRSHQSVKMLQFRGISTLRKTLDADIPDASAGEEPSR